MNSAVRIIMLSIIVGLSAYGYAKIEVSSLRCEYMDNPLGIDNSSPQLSWKLKSKVNNQRQTAYRILVASDAVTLNKNIGDLWDSGKVDSSDETGANYSGKPLVSGQECFWKVMVWDRDGQKSNWSKQKQTASWTAKRIGSTRVAPLSFSVHATAPVQVV